MARRINKIDPKFTDMTAYFANEVYNLLSDKPVIPYKGYKSVLIFKGSNPNIFEKDVEEYGVIFQSEASPDDYVIAFRGTDSKMDIWEDLKFFIEKDFKNYSGITQPGVKVADGFYGIYNDAVTKGGSDSMRNQLFGFLRSHINKKSRISITGHSLGSALAQLFAFDLYTTLSEINFSIEQQNYAAPRVGNEIFTANYVNYENKFSNVAPTIRIVNYEDEVPCFPKGFGYNHQTDYFLIDFWEKGEDAPVHFLTYHHMYNYMVVLKKVVENTPEGYNGTVQGLDVMLKSANPDASKTECPGL